MKFQNSPDTSHVCNPFQNKNVIVYDIETYPNYFLLVTKNEQGMVQQYNQDNWLLFLNSIKENQVYVGYNNYDFDDLIVKFIINRNNICDPLKIFQFAQNLIIQETQTEEVKSFIKKLKWYMKTPWENMGGLSADIYAAIFKATGKTKRAEEDSVSLKFLATKLEMTVQDLPFVPGTHLEEDQKEFLNKYCVNDINVTVALWNHSNVQEVIKSRNSLNTLYSLPNNYLCIANPKIGSTIINSIYADAIGKTPRDVSSIKHTIEDISLKDIVLDSIHYESNELQLFLERLKERTIKFSEGASSSEIEKVLKGITIYYEDKKKDKESDIDYVYITTKETSTPVLKIGNKFYKIGSGGLHSVDSPEIFVSTPEKKIIDVDVSSYYPALIISHNFRPCNFTDVWTKKYTELRDLQVSLKKRAKEEKDPKLAEALKYQRTGLKEAFLSIFGQYAYTDIAAFYKVTINGQLAILMLIERLAKVGIDILSANTDGVTCHVTNEQEPVLNTICKQWETEIKVELEHTHIKKYVRLNVNNYIMEKEGKGDDRFKQKGSTFLTKPDLKKSFNNIIVQKALFEYYMNNVPIEQTIKNETNLAMFTLGFKATGHFYMELVHGDIAEPIQKTVKYYISKSEYELRKINKKSKSIIRLNVGKNITITLDPSLEYTDPIDYDWYIDKANKVIKRIEISKGDMGLITEVGTTDELVKIKEIKTVEDNINKTLKDQVNSLEQIGLLLYPQMRGGKNIGKTSPKKVTRDWDWSKYYGAGIYTGIETGIIVFDIDEIEKVPEDIKKLFKPTLTVWHGNYKYEDITSISHKGKLVYKCKNNIFKTNSKNKKSKFAINTGIEVFYGDTVAPRIIGVHPASMEQYKYQGSLEPIPEELENYLLKCKAFSKYKLRKTEDDQIEILDDKTSEKDLPEDYKEKIEYLANLIVPNWKYKGWYGNKLEGHCPFTKLHENTHNDNDFNFYINSHGKVDCGCFHHGECFKYVNILRERLFEAQSEDEQNNKIKEEINKISINIDNHLIMDKISDVYRSNERQIILLAPTGSGKTYEAASFFLEEIKKGNKIIYCADNKGDQEQFEETLKFISGISDLSSIGIFILCMKQNIEEDDDGTSLESLKSESKISQNTRGIVLHKHYLKRKGVSICFYGVVQWIIDNNPIMIVDEADSYLDSLSFNINIGARYKTLQYKNDASGGYHVITPKCLRFHHFGNCDNCDKFHHQDYNVNRFSAPFISTEGRVKNCNFIPEKQSKLQVPEITFTSEVEIPKKKLKIKQIQQHPSFLENKNYIQNLQEDQFFDCKHAISDIIDCSYNPCIYVQYPIYDGKLIDQATVLSLSDEEKKKVQFPNMSCDVEIMSLKDISVLYALKKYCTRIIFQTGTMSGSNIEFLKSIFKNIKVYSFDVPEYLKIDELLVIGYNDRLTHRGKNQSIDKILSKNFNTLIFEPRIEEANNLFEKYKGCNTVRLTKDGELAHIRKVENNDNSITITHSRGNHGRSINLWMFNGVIVNSHIYKPCISFNLISMTIDEINEKLEEDRVSVAIQNCGRILRMSPKDTKERKQGNATTKSRKFIFINECEETFFNKVVEILKKSCIKLTTSYVDTIQDIACTQIKEFMETGEIKTKSKTLLEIAKEEGINKISSHQREEIREMLSKDKIDKIVEDVCSYKEKEFTTKEIKRKIHYSRLDESVKKIIDEYFEEETENEEE